MIKVELSDFDRVRPELNRNCFKRLVGNSTLKKLEITSISDDLVQNAYLKFHTCNLNTFVTEYHLRAYIYMCLDWSIKDYFRLEKKKDKYNVLKDNNYSIKNFELLIDEFDKTTSVFEEKELIKNFIIDINNCSFIKSSKKHKFIELFYLLLDGYPKKEIYEKLNMTKSGVIKKQNVLKKIYNESKNN